MAYGRVNNLALRYTSRTTDLSAGKGMAVGDGVRVLVQALLAIQSSIIRQVRKVEKSRLLHLVLFLEI